MFCPGVVLLDNDGSTVLSLLGGGSVALAAFGALFLLADESLADPRVNKPASRGESATAAGASGIDKSDDWAHVDAEIRFSAKAVSSDAKKIARSSESWQGVCCPSSDSVSAPPP